jgi:transcriptional regulator with XRE-family HTH domain
VTNAPTQSLFRKQLEKRASAIDNLRARAGLSMDDLAKAMGYRGQSSIQRYLSTQYELAFRPEIVQRFRSALLGRGSPPISEEDLEALWVQAQADRTAREVQDPRLTALRSEVDGVTDALLTLPEGRVVLSLPNNMSAKSSTLVRLWLERVLDSTIEDDTTKK